MRACKLGTGESEGGGATGGEGVKIDTYVVKECIALFANRERPQTARHPGCQPPRVAFLVVRSDLLTLVVVSKPVIHLHTYGGAVAVRACGGREACNIGGHRAVSTLKTREVGGEEGVEAFPEALLVGHRHGRERGRTAHGHGGAIAKAAGRVEGELFIAE